MKKKWIVLMGCIIMNLCNVGFKNEHSIIAIPGTGEKVCTTVPLEDYLGAIPETDFSLYRGFYTNDTKYPILRITANEEKANYYYLYQTSFCGGISSLGYSYSIDEDKLVIAPTWRREEIIGADRSKRFVISCVATKDYYVFATGYQTRDDNATDWAKLTCVELNDVYYGMEKLEQKGIFPAVISCGGNLMINEEILQQFLDIPVYETAEEKSEAEKQKKQEEKKANAIFLGLCAVVIIFYQLKERKLF